MKMSLQAKRPRPTTSTTPARQRAPLAPTSTAHQHSHPEIPTQGTHTRRLDYSLARIPIFPLASDGAHTTETADQSGAPTIASQNRSATTEEGPRQGTSEDVQNKNSVPDNLSIRPAKHAARFGHSLSRIPINPSAETAQPSGSGRPLPEVVRQKMETTFGQDFSMVRIHEGPQASARHAIAYARGTDIHFAPGSYQPHTTRGTSLLAHELTHVVQQRLGRVPGSNRVNDDPLLEHEADQGAIQAMERKAVHLQQAPLETNISPTEESPFQLNGSDVEDIEVDSKGKRVREEDKDYTPGGKGKKRGKVDPERSKATKEKNEALEEVGNKLIAAINEKIKDSGIQVKGSKFKTTVPTIIATRKGQTQVRKPQPFGVKRKTQVKRHVATVVHTYHNRQNASLQSMEIQAAHEEGDPDTLGIAANEDSVNEHLRTKITGIDDLKVQARFLINNPPKNPKNKYQAIRQLRHAAKLLRDKYGEFNKFKKVVIPAKGEGKDIHAEVRLYNAGYREAAGVKRPCVSCAITLNDHGQEVNTTGPIWLSIGSLQPLLEAKGFRDIEKTTDLTDDQIKGLADLIAETTKKIHLTYTSEQHEATSGYDSESDSELDTTSDPEDENEDMALIRMAEEEIKKLREQKSSSKKKKKTKTSSKKK